MMEAHSTVWDIAVLCMEDKTDYKFIYTDFDGVLNSQQSDIYYRRRQKAATLLYREDEFCPIAVSNYRYLLEKLPGDWKIICSSSWRRLGLQEVKRIFKEKIGANPDLVMGLTNDLSVGDMINEHLRDKTSSRYREIFAHLRRWPFKSVDSQTLMDLPEGKELQDIGRIEDFIVLDDDKMAFDADYGLSPKNYVKVDPLVGLTIRDVIYLLNSRGVKIDPHQLELPCPEY
jgi:hypothetical protein